MKEPKRYRIKGLAQKTYDVILAIVAHNARTYREAVALFSTLKYLFRYRHKGGLEDLNKATDFLEELKKEVAHIEKEVCNDCKL